MNPRKVFEYTDEEKVFMNEVLENGFRLSSDVFEEPVYVEIVTCEYNNEIYYFRIVTGKIVSFRKLSK